MAVQARAGTVGAHLERREANPVGLDSEAAMNAIELQSLSFRPQGRAYYLEVLDAHRRRFEPPGPSFGSAA